MAKTPSRFLSNYTAHPCASTLLTNINITSPIEHTPGSLKEVRASEKAVQEIG